MNPEQMMALRPKASTLEAIQDSLARIGAADAAMRAELAKLDASRGEIVMSGTAQQIAAARTATVDATRSLDELADLRKLVEQQVHVVKRADAIRGSQELARVAEEKSVSFNTWHLKHYAVHAQAIADGMKLEEEARVAHRRLNDFVRRNPILDGSEPTAPSSPHVQHSLGYSFGDKVRLPGVAGGPHSRIQDPPFWWPRDDVLDVGAVSALRLDAESAAKARRSDAAISTSSASPSDRSWDDSMEAARTKVVTPMPSASPENSMWDRVMRKVGKP